MAEYLIYNRDYETAYKKGDIIEVREDGYFDKHGFNKNAFSLICIEKQKKEEYYSSTLYKINGQMINKRRFNIDTSKFVFTDSVCHEKDFNKLDIVERFILDTSITRYICDQAFKGGDGLSWSTAFNVLPDNLERGFTYYISTGIYKSKIFNDAEIGEAIITIKKATKIDHGTDTGWKDVYGEGQAIFQVLDSSFDLAIFDIRQGYYVIDGVINNGIKFYTNTSDVDYLIGIVDGEYLGRKLYNIEIKNCELEHKGCNNTDGGGRGFQVHSQAGLENGLIKNCYIHDIPGISIYFYNTNNTIVESCYIARNRSDPVSHGEGIQSGGSCDNITIKNNTWEDIEGTAIIVGRGINWKIYGNLCYHTLNYPNEGQYGDGISMGILTNPIGGNRVFNNTIYNLKGINGAVNFNETLNNLVYNNMFVSCQRLRFISCLADYNYFYDNEDELIPSGDNNQIDFSNIFEDPDNNKFYPLRQTNKGIILDKEYYIDKDGIEKEFNTIGAYEYRGLA